VPVHVEVTPQVGYLWFNGDPDRGVEVNDDAVLWQLRLGVVPASRWGVEGSLGVVATEYDPEQADRHSFFLSGAVRHRFANRTPLTPFLAAGLELLAMDTSVTGDKSGLALVWGGGLEVATGRTVAVRLDVRQHHFRVEPAETESDSESFWLDHYEVGLGIVWRPWG
jgi:hypothetical protein